MLIPRSCAKKFVAHEGKKTLVINYNASNRYAVDYIEFALQMSHLLEENVDDKDLRSWIMRKSILFIRPK